MVLLACSLTALAVGPALYHLARSRAWATLLLDNFILVTIGGVVLLHSLPHSFEAIGALSLVMIAIGLLVPSAAERLLTRAANQVHLTTLALAIGGFCFHALLDGLALSSNDRQLAMAIVLHRIPDGMIIWWLLKEPYGWSASIASLLLIALATIGGFLLGAPLSSAIGPVLLGVIQALVGGMLLHVALHRPHAEGRSPDGKRRWILEAAGILAGLGMLAGLNPLHHEHHGESESLWPTLIGAGILALFIARRFLAREHAHEHAHDHEQR